MAALGAAAAELEWYYLHDESGEQIGPLMNSDLAGAGGISKETLFWAEHLEEWTAVVDIDDLADIAMEHDVHAIPTVIGVKNGQIVDKFVGMKDEDQLTSFINKLRD